MVAFTITIDDGTGPVEPYQVELPDLRAARLEAARLLMEMLELAPNVLRQTEAWQVSVQSADLLLFELFALIVAGPLAGQRTKGDGED